MPSYLVTGATRGIGRAVVDVLAEHDLVLVGRRRGALRELCARLPSASFVVADLGVPGDLAESFSKVRLPHELDGVVHAAGVSRRGGLDEFGVEAWHEMMAVNVVSVAEVTRIVLPALTRARGSVVLLNSGAGRSQPRPGGSAYAATKHALRALADGLRAEAPRVRVSSVFLGPVATDMQRDLHQYEGRPYEAERYLDAAAVASFLRELLLLPPGTTVPEVTMMPSAAGPPGSDRTQDVG